MFKPGALTVADTLGALEVGVMVSSLLYGMTCGQVYLYATQPKRRPATLTLIVTLVMSLESIHLIYMWIYFFDITVTNFGNPFAIISVTWRYGIMLGAHALLVTVVELFFCYRVWVLSRSPWIAFPPALASLARGGITIALAVLDITIGTGIFHDKSSGELFYSALIISAAVDLWITLSLCIVLWNKRTGHRRTIKIVTAIVRRTLESGVLITVTAIVVLAVFAALPFTGYWNGLLMIYPRLYANSFLTSLGSTLDLNTGSRARRTTIVDDSNFVFATGSGAVVAPKGQVGDWPPKQQFHAKVPDGVAREFGEDNEYSEMTFVEVDVDEEDIGTQKIHGGQISHWPRYTV